MLSGAFQHARWDEIASHITRRNGKLTALVFTSHHLTQHSTQVRQLSTYPLTCAPFCDPIGLLLRPRRGRLLKNEGQEGQEAQGRRNRIHDAGDICTCMSPIEQGFTMRCNKPTELPPPPGVSSQLVSTPHNHSPWSKNTLHGAEPHLRAALAVFLHSSSSGSGPLLARRLLLGAYVTHPASITQRFRTCMLEGVGMHEERWGVLPPLCIRKSATDTHDEERDVS